MTQPYNSTLPVKTSGTASYLSAAATLYDQAGISIREIADRLNITELEVRSLIPTKAPATRQRKKLARVDEPMVPDCKDCEEKHLAQKRSGLLRPPVRRHVIYREGSLLD